MSRLKIWTVVALAVAIVPLTAAAPPLKLATVVPTNSPWHKALLDMAASMKTDTADRVSLTIFPDGKLGGEDLIVKQMRINQTQMSLMLLAGLSDIDDSFNALGMPFFFNSIEEARAVVAKVSPMIEQRIAAKKFHLLSWTNGGWVQIFSKNPLKTLADVKKAKLFTSSGDQKMVTWYKANGFNPVALAATDIGPQMKFGMIDAAPMPAYPSMLLLLYKDAPNMLDVHIAPLLGALVITTDAWNKISPDDQAKLTAAAKAFEERTSKEVPALEASSIVEMKKRGLTVNTLDPKAAEEFHSQADKLVASMKGDMVPADLFDAVKTARDQYRASNKK